MYLIQTRKEKQIRCYTDFMNSPGNAEDWNNYPHQYEDIEKAKEECELLIKSGLHKAENVRILEVVCTFYAEIKVKSNGK